MKNLRNKFRQELIAPTATSYGALESVGRVIKANERGNVCTVEFMNKEGRKVKEYNVPVSIYNKNIIDWFPQENDNVIIVESSGDYSIKGPSMDKGYIDIRNSIKMEQDIYSETYSDFLGGYIY